MNDISACIINHFERIDGADKGYTDDWLTGRDCTFSFMGSTNLPLTGMDMEYLQVWEGGQFDTLRLEQLVEEYDQLKDACSKYIGFSAYSTAAENGRNHLDAVNKTSQLYVDNLADAIVTARNEMTMEASADSGKIYSVELLNGASSPVGKQTAVQIITAPDVAKVSVGSETLLAYSSKLQTIKLGNQPTLVMVWLVTWQSDVKSEQEVTFDVCSYKVNAENASDTYPITVSYR